MKVLHVLWSPQFGGIGKLVLDLSLAQIKDCQQVDIFFGGQGEDEFLHNFEASGLQCHFADLKNGFDFDVRKLQTTIQIFRDYDILHFHTFNPFLCWCAVISDRKIVFTEHGNFGFGRKKGPMDTLKTLLLSRFLNSHADYISFNSNFTKRFAEEKYKFNGVDRGVVYNGINFQRKSRSTPLDEKIERRLKGKFVVGTSSRFAGFKRIDRLIEAFAKFQVDKEARLLLVGDGILREQLEKLVEELGISGQTVFAGFKDNVDRYQELMDVCVFPSENEPFGIAALETLALGKPTIVFGDGGGIVEVVGACSAGSVVYDVDGLVDTLEHCFQNWSQLQEKSEYLKEYARQFDIQKMTSRFDTIYSRLISCAA